MRAAFKDEERTGYFAHIESKACQKALDNQKSLKTLRMKLRKIAKKANKSGKFKYALASQQKTRGLKERTLKQEVKTRFTATHTMIRSFLNDPNEGMDVDMDEEKIDVNIEAINHAMLEAKFSKKDQAKLLIKQEDVLKMKNLVKILDVLEEGITLIGAEKYATGSAVLPFLHKFNKVLEADESDLVYISKFKSDLKRELNTRCDLNLNMDILSKASFFDKRFSLLKFLENDEKERIVEEIREELKEMEKTVEKAPSSDQPPAKKKRFLGLGLADSDDDDGIASKGAEGEFERFLEEKKLSSDGCPFAWWRQRKLEFPMMSRLARKYLAVQGSATPAERIMSRLGLVLTKTRQSLPGENFGMMMFLSDVV